jgi:hypothetical protein
MVLLTAATISLRNSDAGNLATTKCSSLTQIKREHQVTNVGRRPLLHKNKQCPGRDNESSREH